MTKGAIDEFVTVCMNSGENSVVRLTIPASQPQWARGFRADEHGNPLQKAEKLFAEHSPTYLSQYMEFVPNDKEISAKDFLPPHFYDLLQLFIRTAITLGLSPYSGKRFLPIQTSVYSDGAPMLSVTGIICTYDNERAIAKHFSKYFNYGCCSWTKPDIIDVPRLSTKERFHIDSRLPSRVPTGKAVKQALKYRIGEDDEDHLYKCFQYEKYFALYPYFERILP